jgi:hypothetical protein
LSGLTGFVPVIRITPVIALETGNKFTLFGYGMVKNLRRFIRCIIETGLGKALITPAKQAFLCTIIDRWRKL